MTTTNQKGKERKEKASIARAPCSTIHDFNIVVSSWLGRAIIILSPFVRSVSRVPATLLLSPTPTPPKPPIIVSAVDYTIIILLLLIWLLLFIYDTDDEWRERERSKWRQKHAKALPFFPPSSLNRKLGEQTTHNKKEKEKKGWTRTRHLCDSIKLALLGSQRDKEETEQQPSERGWRMAYRRRAYYHLFIYYCRRHNTICCCCCLLYANNTHNSTNNNNSTATTTII
jgi:hypothetical protein